MAIYVNGKRIDQFRGQVGNGDQIAIKKIDSVAAGTTFENDGPVEVAGNIGQGATVKIRNGGLTVKGDVADGAKVKVEMADCGGNGTTVISHGRNKVVIRSGRGSVFSSGSISIRRSFSGSSTSVGSTGCSGLSVEGNVGNEVTLVSVTDVNIGNSGDGLKVKAGTDFKGGNLGNNACIESGTDLKAKDAGDSAYLKAGTDLTISSVGANSRISAGTDMELGNLGDNSYAQAGTDLDAHSIGENCTVSAGTDLKAHIAHASSTVTAGCDKKVRNIVGQNTPRVNGGGLRPDDFDF